MRQFSSSHKGIENVEGGWALFGMAILVALSARLFVVFFEATSWWATDTYLYSEQAKQILSGHWPNAAPNGYPLLIAALMMVFGDGWDLSAVLLNVVFSVAVVGIVFLLSLERSGSKRIAFFAALIAALWPAQLVWVRVLYTEVPSTFFLCCALYLCWRRHDFIGGIFLAAAFLIRPTLLPIVVVIGFILLLANEKKRIISTIVVPLLLVFGLQTIKSTPVEGNNGSFLAKNIMLSNFSIRGDSRDDFKYNGETVQEAIGLYFGELIDNPLDFAALRFGHFWELWGAWPDRVNGRKDGTPRSLVRNAILGLQFPLFILGVWGFLRKPDYLGLFLVGPALVITVIHTALFALPRYNYPTVPFMIVLAADVLAVAAARFARPRAQQ